MQELKPTEDPPDIDNFYEWELGDETQAAIAKMGITVPSPIQRLAIGPVLEGRDVIAKAETGTGKTLAFGAPMMARIDAERSSVLGLVLAPTRELAQQVHDEMVKLGEDRGVKTVLIVGGDPMGPQVKALKAGAQVVVGTPGRVLDLYKQQFLSFPWTEFAVLDEADKMFEIGFLDDVKKILSFLPDERQTMLFSATYPREVLQLARDTTKNPVEVATASGTSTVKSIDQKFLEIDDADRPLALLRLMEQSEPSDVFLVFCQRRTEVDRLMRRLERTRFSVKALHGGYDQAARFRVMTAFRTGDVKAMVATDVASRGLDVEHVTHVVNFSVPPEVEEYTHRIGRTGRAGRSGTAITFVIPLERRRWKQHMQNTGWDVEEIDMPGRYGPSKPRPKRSREDGENERGDRDDRGRRSERSRDGERSESKTERRPRRRSEGEDERPRRRPDRESRERTDEESGEKREERPRRRSSESRRTESRDEQSESRRPRRRAPEEQSAERSAEKPSRSRRPGSRGEDDSPRDGRRRERSRSEEPKSQEPRREKAAERAPQRESRPSAKASQPAESSSGFGAGTDDEKPKKRSPKPAAKKKASPKKPAPARKVQKDNSEGGFGAGI